MRRFLPLLLIFSLALALRLYNLGTLPYGLHEDEMMNGYVGRFTLQNGKDLYGNKLPLLYFNNFGDYPPIIPMYLSGVATFLFGLSPFAVRVPIALMGALAIFPAFAILRSIFQKERYALTGAFFIAVLPWHILLSRATAENITATTVFLFSLTLLFAYRKNQQSIYFFSFLLLSFAQYFLYASFRVTVPITLFLALFLRSEKRWRITWIGTALLFFALTFSIGRTVWGQGRFKQTSLFYFNGALSQRLSQFAREEGEGHALSVKAFHNKPIAYVREFIRQYGSYFSPTFLFSDGGLPERYRMEDSGLLYVSFAVFGVAAFGAGLAKRQSDTGLYMQNGRELLLFLLALLLIAPIPSALTLDDVPNVHRSAMVGVMLIFPITLWFAKLETLHWKKISMQAIGIIAVCIELVYFWHQFSVHMPFIQSVNRGDDRTSLAKYLVLHHNEYDKVFVPYDAKPLYYLFYAKNLDPNLAGKFREHIAIDQVDNLVFIGDNCPSQTAEITPTPRSLIIDRAYCDTRLGTYQIAQVQNFVGSGSFKLLIPEPIIKPKPFVVSFSPSSL